MTIECPKPLLLAVRTGNDEPRTHEENRLRVQDWGDQLCRLLHALDARITALENEPPPSASIAVEDEGVPQGSVSALDFVGPGVSAAVGGATGTITVAAGAGAHAGSHENGGADEIDVGGLSGELADPQPPKAHETSHRSGGSDPLSVLNLAGYPGGGTTFLRDDGTFAAPPGGSSPQLIVPFIAEGANAADTNATAAARFFQGSHRHVQRVDLTNMTEVRFLVNRQATNGAAGYTLELRYHTAHATTIGTYSQIGTSAVSVNCVTANTYYQTAWIALAAGAKADVYLAIQGSGGDGVLDPAHGSIVAHFR